MTFYKTLIDGKSCHGGSLQWSLPEGDKPGEWHEAAGNLVACSNGLHVTDAPAWWWKPGCVVYAAEAEGVVGACDDGNDRKVVCRRVRLLRAVTDAAELERLSIFTSGSHEVRAGKVVASGSASVRAYGSASVRAYGSASVEASGSASVVAYGSASVVAYDSASVEASGSASVVAYGSASVVASGSASVVAYDSASVEGKDSVTIVSWRGKPGVKIINRAVWIERGDGSSAPIVHVSNEKGDQQ